MRVWAAGQEGLAAFPASSAVPLWCQYNLVAEAGAPTATPRARSSGMVLWQPADATRACSATASDGARARCCD